MSNLIEMPRREPEEGDGIIKQKLYFEFENKETRAEAMNIINELRKTDPEIFEGLNSIKIDENRKDQGLELAFESEKSGRDQKILDLLHQKGIKLNTQNGQEEMPYAA